MVAALALDEIRPATSNDFAALERATADLDPPYAVVDLAALRRNALDLVRRASGTPIRLASKSVRCRTLTTAALALPGFRGVLALTLAEALWLATDVEGDGGVTDVVVAYPSADRGSLRRLAADAELAARVTLMVDSTAHLDLVASVVGAGGPELRVCLDLDASLRLAGGRVHVGARRSPVHTVGEAVALAREVVRRPGFRLVGLMAYEAQIAGVGDDPAGSVVRRNAIRAVQRRSVPELRDRRAAVVAAVREVAPLAFVNGGGTRVAGDHVERAGGHRGRGRFGAVRAGVVRHLPALPARPRGVLRAVGGAPAVARDRHGGRRRLGGVRHARLRPPAHAGVAAGAAPHRERGRRGEAQTPLFGPGAARLRIGDRVWFRHTKAGELCEHVDDLHLVDGERIVATVPTYRGHGFAFL